MKYIDVNWHSTGAQDPYRLVSELDGHGYELRKLEFFRSGAVGSASAEHETSSTRLGSLELPLLPEILSDPEFTGGEITVQQFDLLWQQYGRPLEPYEVVQLSSTDNGIPASLVGMSAAVLIAHAGTEFPAYEIEFVTSNGTTIWIGTVPRELLRAQPAA